MQVSSEAREELRSLERVLPDMRPYLPSPTLFLEKPQRTYKQVPLLLPFVLVTLANCSDQKKSLKIRIKSSFLISLQNHKTQPSPVSPDFFV